MLFRTDKKLDLFVMRITGIWKTNKIKMTKWAVIFVLPLCKAP